MVFSCLNYDTNQLCRRWIDKPNQSRRCPNEFGGLTPCLLLTKDSSLGNNMLSIQLLTYQSHYVWKHQPMLLRNIIMALTAEGWRFPSCHILLEVLMLSALPCSGGLAMAWIVVTIIEAASGRVLSTAVILYNRASLNKFQTDSTAREAEGASPAPWRYWLIPQQEGHTIHEPLHCS